MTRKKNSGDNFGFAKPNFGKSTEKAKKCFDPKPPLSSTKLSDPPLPDTKIKLVKQAITQKCLIEFYYRGLHRIAEPHILGLKNEVIQVLVYQVRGNSSSIKLPDWRRMNLDDMSSIKVLDETFSTNPPSLDDDHSSWDEILAIVSSPIYQEP